MAIRILRFQVNDYQGIEEAHAELGPDSATVIVHGENEAGKSSLIDALQACLIGKRAMTDVPVREGAARAVLECTVGDADGDKFTVRRTIAATGSVSLTVRRADGNPFAGGQQEMLNKLLPPTFDPMGFPSLKPQDQFKQLMGLHGLEFDFEDNASAIKALIKDREAYGRDKRTAEGGAESLASVPANTPAEPVASQDLLKEIAAAHALNSRRSELTTALQSQTDRIARLKATRDGLIGEIQEHEENLETSRLELVAIVPVDISGLTKQLESVEETNKHVTVAADRKRLLAEAQAHQAKWDGVQDDIAALEAEAATAVSALSIPLEGVTVSETEGVLYEGRPLAQAATSRRIEIATLIALCQSKPFKPLRVNGNELGPERLAEISALVVEHGGQLFIECLKSEVGLHIVDGRLAAEEGGDGE